MTWQQRSVCFVYPIVTNCTFALSLHEKFSFFSKS